MTSTLSTTTPSSSIATITAKTATPTLTTGTPTSSSQTTSTTVHEQETVLALCIEDVENGQTFNQLLAVAAARTIASELTRTLNDNNGSSISHPTNNNNYTIVKVGLGPNFSALYDAVLLPQADILSNYFDSTNSEQLCHYSYFSGTLFELFFSDDWYPHRVQMIQSLIPNQFIQEQASRYLEPYRDSITDTNNNTITTTATIGAENVDAAAPPTTTSTTRRNRRIITVHRRYFEGACPSLSANRQNVACLNSTNGNRKDSTMFLSDTDILNICHRSYNDTVHDDLSHQQQQLQNADQELESDSTVVLLCTDRQVPAYDMTFPNIVTLQPLDELHQHKATLVMIDAWIMTLSDIHYGVPMSTVDVTVHFWRRRNFTTSATGTVRTEPREMRPIVCYGDSS
jgi:hypothetical protein